MNIRINNEVNHNIQGEKYKVDKYPGLTIRLHMFINRYQTQISSREKKKHSYESQAVYYYRLYLNRLTINTEAKNNMHKIWWENVCTSRDIGKDIKISITR